MSPYHMTDMSPIRDISVINNIASMSSRAHNVHTA